MTTTQASPTSERAQIEEALVRDNLALVHYGVSEIASRVPRHVSRDDLMSAAMFGLAQAARTFDGERGIAFDRFAMIRIRGALLDELRGRDWASRSVRLMSRRVDAATDDLTVRLGRAPRLEETAAQMGVPPDAIRRLTEDLHRATVLNYESLVMDGAAEELLPAAEGDDPRDIVEERERRAYLRDAVMALPERLRHVVVGYFFEERPMQEIADELGVSESRVSQMRGEALALLKGGMDSALSPDALPEEPRPNGRLARRKAAYYSAVAAGSDYRTRLDAVPVPVTKRAALAAVELSA